VHEEAITEGAKQITAREKEEKRKEHWAMMKQSRNNYYLSFTILTDFANLRLRFRFNFDSIL